MGLLLQRLVFLGFIGLTAAITYNALYLQEQRNQTVVPKVIRGELPPPIRPSAVAVTRIEPPKIPAVTTDLPPLQGQEAPEQLVAAIQRELSSRGYGTGAAADGKLTNETRNAISAYQKDKGLTVTGKPSDELLRYILLGESMPAPASTGSVTPKAVKQSAAEAKPAPKPVKQASAEPKADAKADASVKQAQQMLADLGYAPGPVDGAMGAETERAIAAFQRDRKLAETGRVSPQLLKEMRAVTGKEIASGASRP